MSQDILTAKAAKNSREGREGDLRACFAIFAAQGS
jgi:hypothetical protein